MKAKDGLSKIIMYLDRIYKEDATRSAFGAYEHFTEFRRSHDMSIEVEFNIRHSKINPLKMTLPDRVIALYLVKSANLTEEHQHICKATCDLLTFAKMREKIERVTSNISKAQKPKPHFYE